MRERNERWVDETLEWYYFNPLVDKEPVRIYIIQQTKPSKPSKDESATKRNIEINRDPNGRAGFWVTKEQLFLKTK